MQALSDIKPTIPLVLVMSMAMSFSLSCNGVGSASPCSSGVGHVGDGTFTLGSLEFALMLTPLMRNMPSLAMANRPPVPVMALTVLRFLGSTRHVS